jgi:glycosyltransferase involved in cell wall biosynthesis
LVEKKGLRYLLEAMPEISARFPGVRLTVVGDGPCRSQLERLAFELGLQGSVAFWGARRNEELPEIYRRSGIVVFPSVVGEDGDREGFGLVLVEALGCGCAAVATDLPAMKDIVENERTALIVRPKSPEAIAGAVLRLLANPQLTAGIAQNGRRHALQHFEWEAIAQGYRVLLKRLPDKLSDSVIERSSSRQFPSWRAHLRFTCAKRWR